MATSIQERTAARGFPVYDTSGQSGQGALPDSTLPAATAPPGSPTATWTDPNVDPGSVAATLPPPEEYVLGQLAWGLSAALNPDNTPRTHAAPMADRGLATSPRAGDLIGDYYAEADATHADEFTGWKIRNRPPTNTRFGFGQQAEEGGSGSNQQPNYKQPTSTLGGKDAVQGFGSMGGGPGGVNKYMPLTTLDRQFPGPEGHPVFLNAAEVPLFTADALQFIPSAAEFGPWLGGGFDVPTASVSAQDVTVSDSPAQGPAVAPSSGLLPLWGGY